MTRYPSIIIGKCSCRQLIVVSLKERVESILQIIDEDCQLKIIIKIIRRCLIIIRSSILIYSYSSGKCYCDTQCS